MNEYKEKIKLWECYEGEFPISQEFGKHFYNQDGKCVYVLMGFDGHNGIDFALPIGTKLTAVSDGKINKTIHQKNGYGNHLRLHCTQGDTNFEVIYAHCSKFLVKQGESVSKGQIIAESGDSGFSSGPHLHFGLRIIDERGNVLNHGNGYKGSIDALPLFDLSESNKPDGQIEEKNNLDKCEPWAEKYWKWFRTQGFDKSVSAYKNVDAQWVATILGEYHERQGNKI